MVTQKFLMEIRQTGDRRWVVYTTWGGVHGALLNNHGTKKRFTTRKAAIIAANRFGSSLGSIPYEVR